MGIVDLWRAARGTVLRKELADVMARLEGANRSARSAFLNNIAQTVDEIVPPYSAASKAERRQIVKQWTQATRELWASGDWPSALGAGISLLNAQSRFIPGDDAAYVKRETDRLIEEARKGV
jgi:hypothetical protein